ncbi:MAG: RagB/SusD family nutrient uptake outer membrane protein [Prolixibacteraceae bacterium]
MKRYNKQQNPSTNWVKILPALLLFMASCSGDFLERPNKENPSVDFLQGGDANAVQLVNAAYSSLQKQGLYTRTASQIAQFRSDESRITKNTPKMEEDGVSVATYTNNAGGTLGEFLWRDSYNGIRRSNVAIENINDNENVSDNLKSRLLGEAYFLRSFYYFHLVLHFGEIIPKQITSKEPLASAFENETAVWNLMIADLKQAKEYFTEANFRNDTWEAEDQGRANLGAATGLLGKIYLFYAQMRLNNEKAYLDSAKQEFLLVADQKVGSYSLLPNYMDNFKNVNEYNDESLFEISFADFGVKTWEIDQDNSGAVETNRIAKNSTMCDGVGEMWWNEAPTARILNEYERNPSGELLDYRCYYTIWFPGGAFYNDYRLIDDVLTENVLAYDQLPWPGLDNSPSSTEWGAEYNDYRFYGWRKYGFDYNYWLKDNICSDHVGSDINYRYMRYADVLLMLAECEYYLGGDPKKYINEVRQRSNNQVADENQSSWGNKDLPYLKSIGSLPQVENSVYASNLEAAIQHERMVELACESTRYFDIIRWHKAGLLLDLRKSGFPKANITELIIDQGFNGNFLLPIPQSELNNNPKMVANSAN